MKSLAVAWVMLAGSAALAAEFEPPTPEEQARIEKKVEKIKDTVAEIRGLPFKEPIGVKNQSVGDFEEYLDNELGRQIPDEKNEIYGIVVGKLGLYRGPEIEDFRSTVKRVMTSQAGAYYDPTTATFYVLMTRMSDIMMGTLYAHELYHGLQDQYFDLNGFLLEKIPELNEDEALARQSVVEGEATLMMTFWMMKTMSGGLPDESVMDMTINMQTGLDTDSMRAMLKSGMINPEEMGDMADATEAMEDLPRFMIETLIGAYMKGMGFVYELYKSGGWDEVAKLYTERPPASTEQILHPEKWLSDETPQKVSWPDFEQEPLFDGWEVLDANTIGEIQMRIIFEEYGMKNRAKAVAEGWDGDRYAVLRKQGGDELMLLLYTCWDSEGDALQFEAAYRDLLKEKYETDDVKSAVLVRESHVFVMESPEIPEDETLAAFAGKITISE